LADLGNRRSFFQEDGGESHEISSGSIIVALGDISGISKTLLREQTIVEFLLNFEVG
jgi:hypothetical protein